jgi:hypothetical protein
MNSPRRLKLWKRKSRLFNLLLKRKRLSFIKRNLL